MHLTIILQSVLYKGTLEKPRAIQVPVYRSPLYCTSLLSWQLVIENFIYSSLVKDHCAVQTCQTSLLHSYTPLYLCNSVVQNCALSPRAALTYGIRMILLYGPTVGLTVPYGSLVRTCYTVSCTKDRIIFQPCCVARYTMYNSVMKYCCVVVLNITRTYPYCIHTASLYSHGSLLYRFPDAQPCGICPLHTVYSVCTVHCALYRTPGCGTRGGPPPATMWWRPGARISSATSSQRSASTPIDDPITLLKIFRGKPWYVWEADDNAGLI
jgi:hypothetical protein